MKDYFSFITKNIIPFRSIFDTWTTDWILSSKTSVIGKKRQVAAIYLTDFLSKWSCVTVDKQTYCKMIITDRKYDIQESKKSYGFVIIKILMKTEYVATGRFYFYNVDIMDRSNIIHSFQAELDRTYFPGTVSNVMIRCKRPLRKLMISYNSELVISNPKVNNVLLRSRWIWWKKGDCKSLYLRVKEIADTLYKQRVSEGFNAVFESAKCISFYLEYDFNDMNCSLVKSCSLQYLILISDDYIATELWSEPLKRTMKDFNRNYLHSDFSEKIFAIDQTVFTYYHTYAIILRSLIPAEGDSKIGNETGLIEAEISNNALEIGIQHYNDEFIVPILCNLLPLLNLANMSVIEFRFIVRDGITETTQENDNIDSTTGN